MPTKTSYFSELIDLRESQLDAATFTVKGVTLIKPGFSTNTDKQGRPRYYSADMLRQSAAKFEGTRAFANHPSKSAQSDLPERDIRDITGYWQNVRASDNGTLIGDLKVVGEAQRTTYPLIAEAILSNPALIQVSINALGTTSLGEAEGRKAVMVESIVAANSVDLVTTGAAGGTFAGALLASDGDEFTSGLLKALTFEEWREARPEYIEKLKVEWKTPRDTDAIKESASQIETLKNEIARLTEAGRTTETELATYRRRDVADRLLEGSALPMKLRPAVLEQLLKETGEDGMKHVLEAEVAKYKATPKPPVEVKQPVPVPVSTSAKPRNPAAALLNLNESSMARPDETLEEYLARRNKQAQ